MKTGGRIFSNLLSLTQHIPPVEPLVYEKLKEMLEFTESRTLTATVRTNDNFSLNSFLSFFTEKGPFNYLSKEIFGIVPTNAYSKSYSITFKPEKSHIIITKLLAEYGQEKLIQTPWHSQVKISFSRPKPPAQTITLWPVSHEISDQMLSDLTAENGWGKLERFAFGRHKNFPQFHNAYLHLQISNCILGNIPEKITINNNPTMVIKPGEFSIPRCNFCREKGHTISDCPKKHKRHNHSQSRSFAQLLGGSGATGFSPRASSQQSQQLQKNDVNQVNSDACRSGTTSPLPRAESQTSEKPEQTSTNRNEKATMVNSDVEEESPIENKSNENRNNESSALIKIASNGEGIAIPSSGENPQIETSDDDRPCSSDESSPTYLTTDEDIRRTRETTQLTPSKTDPLLKLFIPIAYSEDENSFERVLTRRDKRKSNKRERRSNSSEIAPPTKNRNSNKSPQNMSKSFHQPSN